MPISQASKKDKTILINESTLRLLGTVHGLRREGERVRAAFEDMQPDIIAVGIPEEDIKTLDSCISEEINFEASEEQKYYFDYLSTFGEVCIPPTDLVVAHLLAKENNLPLEALDIDDEKYAYLFTKKVSILGLLRMTHKTKKERKRGFSAKSPEAFSLEWNEHINATKQLQDIKTAQQQHMADRLFEITQQYGRILAVLPFPQFEGVLEHLSTLKKHKK